jgi:cytidine deaminase
MSSLDDMIAMAGRAMANAHAPYSRFAVGAALRAASGKLYAGCNVENAAYPQGQCAEASAIGAMVTAGDKRIVEIVVLGSGDALCTPCGGCRQRLVEFATPDTPVHIGNAAGIRQTVTLGELTPLFFGPHNLDR